MVAISVHSAFVWSITVRREWVLGWAVDEGAMKDRLFLLRPGFYNVGLGPLYCTESLPVEGLLSFFPQLRQLIEVHYLEFPRPRQPLAKLLGAGHQGVPVLILAPRRRVRG